MRWNLLLVCVACALLSCGPKPATLEEYRDRVVTLPNGKQVRAEILVTASEMERGMMFRDSIAPDRGMLFFHSTPAKYKYWMFQCRIPLDIIWMDGNRRIVEISADTPPCTGARETCPTFGGNFDALYVLELGGGMAAKYELKTGDVLKF
jgi:uncharacterized membrane protein (UPF0127 family)